MSRRIRIPLWRSEQIRQANIRKYAYRIWEESGRPDGCDLECWLAGEKEYEADLDRFYGSRQDAELPSYAE